MRLGGDAGYETLGFFQRYSEAISQLTKSGSNALLKTNTQSILTIHRIAITRQEIQIALLSIETINKNIKTISTPIEGYYTRPSGSVRPCPSLPRLVQQPLIMTISA